MSAANQFPEELLLHEPERRARLIREFYEQYGEARPRGYYAWGHQHEETKAAFYRKCLEANGQDVRHLGVDVGCQGGVLINMVNLISWVGVDIDQRALEAARENGVACHEMDFTSAINFRDESFDAVMMTEVLEHLPYPSITVREVHRILKKKAGSAYVGSAPSITTCIGAGKYCAANGSRESKPTSTIFPSRSSTSFCGFISRRWITCRSAERPRGIRPGIFPTTSLSATSPGPHRRPGKMSDAGK